MLEMSDDRIAKWKCLFCGSKLKKVISTNSDGCTENGYALHCCNCGHLDIFSLDGNSIDSALGIGNKLKERNIRCGIKPEEIGKCYLKECPFRKNIENKKGEEK